MFVPNANQQIKLYTIMMNRYKMSAAVLISLGIVLLFGIKLTQAQHGKNTTLKFDSKKDTIYTPKVESIQDNLTLSGSIDTDQIANVTFQNPGKLVWVGVKVGDYVKKGQAIASLDQKELRKNLQTQFNNYESQLSSFDDTNDQYKPQKDALLVTDTIKRILTRTQNSLDNAVINYELTDMAIHDATIFSPIEGVVTAVTQPFAGVNVTPLNATFTIINPNSIYFKSEIGQESINQVKVGQTSSLRLDSFPDKKIDSSVSYIAFTPVTGQTSTVYEIRFKLPIDNNSNLEYRYGMDGDATVTLAQADNVVTVPTDAINDDNGQRYVYIKQDNTLVRRDVTTGIENDTTTQITQGVSQNDQVVIIQK